MKLFVLTYNGHDELYTEEDLVVMLGNNLPGELLMDAMNTLDIGDQYGEWGPDGENLNIKRIE